MQRDKCVKPFNHMYGLPVCLKFAYVYHIFNVKQSVSEMLAGLVWSTRFGSGSSLNKKREERRRLLFLNSLTLSDVHQSSVATIIL